MGPQSCPSVGFKSALVSSALIQLSAAKIPLHHSILRQPKLVYRRVHSSTGRQLHINCALSGRSDRELGSNDDWFQEKPFWSTLLKETFQGLKSLLAFLAEQPGQLKYIEWPSFQSMYRWTFRTATLTLVLVAIFIVALSSIDSALSYLLALLLRSTA